MRSFVVRDRRRFFSYTVSVLALSAVVAGCSTDFDRFSRSALPKATQTTADQTNAYPANVDPTTTASVSNRVVPVGSIGGGALATTPQGVYHKPEPMYVAPAKPAATYSNPYPNTTNQPVVSQKTDLPSPVQLPAPHAQPVSYETTASVAQPATDVSDSNSVAPVTPQVAYVPASATPSTPTPPTNGGWGDGNGTRYQVKSGETLFNLSKRFGVPVSALMTANSIEDSNDIQAGQLITIPNYNYAETAPVSAPDFDPNTRAARASTGLIGEANLSQNIVPTRRPIQTASLGTSQNLVAPIEQAADQTKSDAETFISSDISGKHKVRPGDSLSKIASSNGVSIADLKRINGLSSDSIRIGQTLNIPVASQTQIASNTKSATQVVSTVTTGGTKRKETSTELASAYAKPEPVSKEVSVGSTPEASGISQFRWPVKGRVVTKYGEKDGSQKNDGIDISVPEGTAVRATENGVVIYAGNDIETYGNLLLVRHENGWVSAYAHNKSFDVKKGSSIRRGQIIARSGRTGHAQQPKLHFELRKNSEPVDPMKHLARI